MTQKTLPAMLAVAFVVAGAASALAIKKSFTSYQNQRFGYSIAYPEGVFKPEPEKASADGQMLVSPDGRARLLIGAFENEGGDSLEAYRQHVIAQSYSGARIGYAPVRSKWFVLSGERDGNTFYERVTFTCGGRIINSWAMIYPTAEGATYDRVVEMVARTYAAGAGPNGKCEVAAAEAAPEITPPANER